MLNITDSDKYLKCTADEKNRAVLTVEVRKQRVTELVYTAEFSELKHHLLFRFLQTNSLVFLFLFQRWEKGKLNSFSKEDQTTLPFLFYLSCTKDNLSHFESANCAGWFICEESYQVCMGNGKVKDKEKISFIVIPPINTSKSK